MLRMEPEQILHDYIATELERGVDRELIISHLIENGWEQDAVLSAMDAFPLSDESATPVSEDSGLATNDEEVVPEETGLETPPAITEAESPAEVSDESTDTEAPVQEIDTTETTSELSEETALDEQAQPEQEVSEQSEITEDAVEELSEAANDSSSTDEENADSLSVSEDFSEAKNVEAPQDEVADEPSEESNEIVNTEELTEVDSVTDQISIEESTAIESAEEPIDQEVVTDEGNNSPKTSDEAAASSDTIDLNEEVAPLSEQTETSPETIIEPTADTQAIEQPEEEKDQPVSQEDVEAPTPQEPVATPAQEEQSATQPTRADQAVTAEAQPSVKAPAQDTAPVALETPAAPTIVAPTKKDNVVVKRIITIAISVVIVGIALLVFSIATNADTNPNNAVGTTAEPIEDINYSLTLPPDWRPDTGDISGSGLRTYSKTDGSQVYARVYVYNKVPNSLLDHVVNQVNSLKDSGIAAEQVKLSIPGAVSSQAKVLQVYKGTTATNTVNYYVYAGVDKGQVTYSIDMVIPDKYPDVINRDLGEFLAGFTPKSESLGSQITP